MPKKISIKKAKCTGLSLLALVRMAEEGQDQGKFLIEAYTGKQVERWWGQLAIDIDGIKAKKKIPVLMNHNPSEIIGFSTDTYKDGSFFVSGKFSNATTAAKEVRSLSAEGFPWQASIGVRPLKILSLEKGSTQEVNGDLVSGPAEVWMESEVFETSFVPLGADDYTNISTFSKFEEEAQQGAKPKTHKKEKIMPTTLEELKKDAPALLEEIQAAAVAKGIDEGIKLGKESILELAKEHFSDGEAFETLAKSGVTLEQYKAIKSLQPKQADETELKAKILSELEADKIGDPGAGADDGKGPKTFMEAWKGIKEADKLSTQKAMSKASKDFPELFKKHSKGGK